MIIKKAVIPAAGYGTRFLPITKGVPKEMLPIFDKPALQLIAEDAAAAGVEEIIFVIGKNKEGVRRYFGKDEVYDGMTDRSRLKSIDELRERVKFTFVTQEAMRGNGDAVLSAKDAVGDEPFLTLFGDDVIYNERKSSAAQLAEAFYKKQKTIIGVQECDENVASSCGCILPGKREGRIVEAFDIIEKPPIDKLPSHFASMGRFVLTPDIFDALNAAPLFKGELYLTIAIAELLRTKGGYAYEFEGIRYDIGNKLGFLKANVEFALRNESYGAAAREYLKNLTETL